MGIHTDIVVVPDLSAAELVRKFDREFERSGIPLTYLDLIWKKWDFIRDERGKRYEVVIWAPDRDVSTENVRRHFRERKAPGNTAAFVSWVMEHKPNGFHASIPEDDVLFRGEHDHLYAPDFRRDHGHRDFNVYDVKNDWSKSWTFAGFRAIP